MASIVDITGHIVADDERVQRLTRQSSLREKVFEFQLLGELGIEMLARGMDFAVLHSTSDRDGYDVVIETGPIVRHIQLKTTTIDTTTREVPINMRLASKPAGCVLWSVFDPEVRRFVEYRWFGAMSGHPIPDLGERAVRHSRANAAGVKAIRPDMRSLGLARFELLYTIEAVADRLFGEEAA